MVTLKRTGKLVKILRQTAQFIPAGDRDAGGEIARRQLMGAFHQSFDRRQQPAGQREGGQRGEEGGKGDNQPTGAFLLAVEIDIRVAREPLNRRGDHRPDGHAVDDNVTAGTVLRNRRPRAYQHAPLLIDNPKLRAPAVWRHIGPRARPGHWPWLAMWARTTRRAFVVIPLEGAQ